MVNDVDVPFVGVDVSGNFPDVFVWLFPGEVKKRENGLC